MKKFLLVVTLLGLLFTAHAQEETLDASVEKSLFGIQTGFLGIWGHNETRLSDAIALRTEIGLDGGVWGGKLYSGTDFLLTPVITAEPRWYYNLNKRQDKSKRIDGNSGNFLSLKTSFHPDWFVIGNDDNIILISDLTFVPTWGLRRNIGKHFNYEAGIGVGYRYIFDDYIRDRKDKFTGNLHLRIGYAF